MTSATADSSRSGDLNDFRSRIGSTRGSVSPTRSERDRDYDRDSNRDRDRDRDRDHYRERDSDRRHRDDRDYDYGRDRRDRDREYGRDRRDVDDRRRRDREGSEYHSRSPRRDDRDRERDSRRYDDRGYRNERDDRSSNRDQDRSSRRSPTVSANRDHDRTRDARVARSVSPRLSEDERDKRTIFVQQLAARLRTKELMKFFEQAGPVRDAQIVKDRVSGRSKGVGYVEFRDIESVQKAINMTGQKLLDIPVIVQVTEAEKNRLARAESSASAQQALEEQRQQIGGHGPYHRLYVGNIHFAVTESDLKQIFQSYGDVDFVVLQKDESSRSKGYGFVQFADRESAQSALELNGFKLGGRPIRVGHGNEKINSEAAETLLQRLNGSPGGELASGGMTHSNSTSVLDTRLHSASRARDEKKPTGALVSALDDADVAGVSFNSVSRESLMKKLMREEDSLPMPEMALKTPVKAGSATQPSRCIVLRDMFDPSEEEGDDWVNELQDDVKAECEDKYGKVVHIAVDPNSQGEIFVKFQDIAGGERAIQGLNGRFFGGRQISATPVVDMVYSLRCVHT
ncbi:uncharacterized protein V1518DRAFT_373171 [Limtongia smithiae]|uniref:uncharacterized protein n=1 Tax=Limtongia smithiae TaxID=1125753 RepID=UPI0034CE2113